MIYIFLKAFFASFAIAMPIGPIGILCIQNSLVHGFKMGMLVGIGCALSDSLYGLIASGGFVFVSYFLHNNAIIIKLIGSSLLLFLGCKELKDSKKNLKNLVFKRNNGIKTATSAFCVNLTNPMTSVILFSAIFSYFEKNQLSNMDISAAVFGVFCGSLTWWLILSGTVSMMKNKISNEWLVKIKIISGLILICLGFSIFYHIFSSYFNI